jgi:hypothetical protein
MNGANIYIYGKATDGLNIIASIAKRLTHGILL